MKKILLILSLVFIVTACSTVNTAENNETQVKRLLKEAEKKEKAAEKQRIEENKKLEDEKLAEAEARGTETNSEIKEESAEVVEEVKKEKWVNPHEGKTRGEIMQYEMERVRAEMEALQTSVDDYAKRTKMLKEYKEKLEKLEKLNQASMQ